MLIMSVRTGWCGWGNAGGGGHGHVNDKHVDDDDDDGVRICVR